MARPPRCSPTFWRRTPGGDPQRDRVFAGGVGRRRPAARRLPGVAGRVLRRRRGSLARGHARPRPARSGDERRVARDRRPHPVARGVVQGAARPRPRNRGRSRRLSAGRRPGRLCRRSGAQLGAAARQAAGRAADRDRARQLPEPRRPHRQRGRARHAGFGGRDPEGVARRRIPHRRHARGRRRADAASARRPEQRAALRAGRGNACPSPNIRRSSPACRNRCSSRCRSAGARPSATRSSVRGGSIAAGSRSPASASAISRC